MHIADPAPDGQALDAGRGHARILLAAVGSIGTDEIATVAGDGTGRASHGGRHALDERIVSSCARSSSKMTHFLPKD
jgi:hypothetical protein